MNKKYEISFKRECVEKSRAMKDTTVVEICKQFGIHTSMLRKWKIAYDSGKFDTEVKKQVSKKVSERDDQLSLILENQANMIDTQRRIHERLDAIYLCMSAL